MRFSILSLMVMVAVLALGCGAMVSHTPYLAIAFLSLLGLAMLFAPVWATYGSGHFHYFSGGFSIAAWLNVFIVYFFSYFGGVPGPYLFVNFVLRTFGEAAFGGKETSNDLSFDFGQRSDMGPMDSGAPSGVNKQEWERIVSVGQGLAIFVVAWLAGNLAMFLAAKRERKEPPKALTAAESPGGTAT
nr:protein of unknown function (DUF2892) [uncultured bacterium]